MQSLVKKYFDYKGPIHNIQSLVQIMACRVFVANDDPARPYTYIYIYICSNNHQKLYVYTC